MWRARGAAAALLLAACSVDVEGARCRVPGATEDCPSGQACGNDGACSARALACEAAGTRCAPGAARCAGTDAVERCAASDPACGAWEVEDCAAAGLSCGERSGAAACECPAYEALEVFADPGDGSFAGEPPFPTGASAPAACRFRRLGDALERAAALAGEAQDPVVVQPHAAAPPAIFGDAATGETFPLAVAPGVVLRGGWSPAGATVVRAQGATAEPLIRLEGAIQEVRIESVPLAGEGLGAPTGAAIVAGCGGEDGPSIALVAVDGGGTLTRGIDVDVVGGACGADLRGVQVSGIDGPALAVVGDPAAEDRVRVHDGAFRESAVGVRVSGGKVTLAGLTPPEVDPDDAVEVSGNAGEGIVLTGGVAQKLDVELLGARVAGNGGTGILLDVVKPSSRLVVRGCEVHANGGASPIRYGLALERAAGGMLVRQGSLTGELVFEGNRLYANAADQLGFFSSGAWSIAPAAGACGPASNLFACVDVDGGHAAVAVAGSPLGSVDASWSVWPGSPWDGYASAGVIIGSPAATCPAGTGGADEPPALPLCPP